MMSAKPSPLTSPAATRDAAAEDRVVGEERADRGAVGVEHFDQRPAAVARAGDDLVNAVAVQVADGDERAAAEVRLVGEELTNQLERGAVEDADVRPTAEARGGDQVRDAVAGHVSDGDADAAGEALVVDEGVEEHLIGVATVDADSGSAAGVRADGVDRAAGRAVLEVGAGHPGRAAGHNGELVAGRAARPLAVEEDRDVVAAAHADTVAAAVGLVAGEHAELAEGRHAVLAADVQRQDFAEAVVEVGNLRVGDEDVVAALRGRVVTQVKAVEALVGEVVGSAGAVGGAGESQPVGDVQHRDAERPVEVEAAVGQVLGGEHDFTTEPAGVEDGEAVGPGAAVEVGEGDVGEGERCPDAREEAGVRAGEGDAGALGLAVVAAEDADAVATGAAVEADAGGEVLAIARVEGERVRAGPALEADGAERGLGVEREHVVAVVCPGSENC